jgi:hypothetical protein
MLRAVSFVRNQQDEDVSGDDQPTCVHRERTKTRASITKVNSQWLRGRRSSTWDASRCVSRRHEQFRDFRLRNLRLRT